MKKTAGSRINSTSNDMDKLNYVPMAKAPKNMSKKSKGYSKKNKY